MEINLLLLGSMFILTMFTVGESIYKHFKINKYFILGLIALLFIGYFLPNIEIYEFSLPISSVLLPTAICFFALFKVKKFSRFALSFLICVLASVIFNLVNIEIYFNSLLQPYMILFCVLGVLVSFISYNLPSCISSIFFGILTGNILFNLAKFESLENMFLSAEFFPSVLIAFISAGIFLFIKQKLYQQIESSSELQNISE